MEDNKKKDFAFQGLWDLTHQDELPKEATPEEYYAIKDTFPTLYDEIIQGEKKEAKEEDKKDNENL